jgi:hypothetical protein
MDLVGICLGWVLGLLGTPLLLGINNFFERRRFVSTLKAELTETKFRLVLRIFILARQLKIMDRKMLEWVVLRVESCDPLDDYKMDFLLRHKRLLQLSENQLSTSLMPIYEEGTAIGPISTPYLNAKLESVGMLAAGSQRCLVNFLFHMDTLNTKAQENAHWTTMSFSSSEKELVNIEKNISYSVAAWISSAECAVEDIELFMNGI